MKCEDIVELAQSGESGVMDETGHQFVVEHIAGCVDCQYALRGVEATRWLRHQAVEDPDADLFSRTMGAVFDQAVPVPSGRRNFWLGTGVGSAVAATLFAAVVALGMLGAPDSQDSNAAEFTVSLTEARDLNIAIDAATELPDAQLSISFFGGIELAGYASQRHLTWTADLDKGVNKLSLPIIALDKSGGQVVVRLEHPESQQEFLVKLQHGG